VKECELSCYLCVTGNILEATFVDVVQEQALPFAIGYRNFYTQRYLAPLVIEQAFSLHSVSVTFAKHTSFCH
jgi:hypothetical protein